MTVLLPMTYSASFHAVPPARVWHHLLWDGTSYINQDMPYRLAYNTTFSFFETESLYVALAVMDLSV